jgi:outer membrane lipoprotein-sorting protein
MKKFIFSLLAALVLGTPLGAQSLDEILATHYQARGGLDKLKSLAGRKMTGKIAVPALGLELPVVIWQKTPDKMRVESTFQGKTIVQACAGLKAWWIMPFLSEQAQEMPPEQGRLFRDQADFADPLVDYKGKGYLLELLGKEELQGTPVFKLKLTRDGGREIYFFLDAGSGSELKSMRLMKIGESESLVEILYGDYREVGGHMLPFAIENRLNGEPQMKMTLDAIEINPVIEDAFFVMPEKKEAPGAGDKK